MKKRGQLNISFGWLFAILVGATILVFAIFFAGKVIKTGNQASQTSGAKEFGILLNPLQTSFESALSTSISRQVETKIYNTCFEAGNFGKQKINFNSKNHNLNQTHRKYK